jgi:hypothetical protein
LAFDEFASPGITVTFIHSFKVSGSLPLAPLPLVNSSLPLAGLLLVSGSFPLAALPLAALPLAALLLVSGSLPLASLPLAAALPLQRQGTEGENTPAMPAPAHKFMAVQTMPAPVHKFMAVQTKECRDGWGRTCQLQGGHHKPYLHED